MFKRIIILFSAFLLLGLGKRIFNWSRGNWDGKAQISLAIETNTGKILIFILTPAKNMSTVVIVPGESIVETPWFGAYQAKKLSLLAKQEGTPSVFSRSLAYFLGMPIDRGFIETNLSVDQYDKKTIRSKLRRFFSPFRSIDNLRIWHWLGSREHVWKIINLVDFGRETSLPDGSSVLVVDTKAISDRFWELFTDPMIKNEDIPVSVFNSGEVSGLAEKAAIIIRNFGGRVVEVADRKMEEEEECLILISGFVPEHTATVRRLESVFGCRSKVGEREGIGDIQILFKNVKM